MAVTIGFELGMDPSYVAFISILLGFTFRLVVLGYKPVLHYHWKSFIRGLLKLPVHD